MNCQGTDVKPAKSIFDTVPTPRPFQVAGVDGCKAGWFVATVWVTKESSQTDTPCVFELKDVLVASTFTGVLSKTAGCKLVCVDIPIGLSDGNKPRECDLAGRRILRGPRASSVFPAPIRACVSYRKYTGANAVSRRLTGKGISKQSFAILDRIRQVDSVMTPQLQKRVREIHPEICFWALNGHSPIPESKHSRAGQTKRYELLTGVFHVVDKCLRTVNMKGYAVDDVYDALAAAYTAGRAALGRAATLPANPEIDANGLRMEMVYPVEVI